MVTEHSPAFTGQPLWGKIGLWRRPFGVRAQPVTSNSQWNQLTHGSRPSGHRRLYRRSAALTVWAWPQRVAAVAESSITTVHQVRSAVRSPKNTPLLSPFKPGILVSLSLFFPPVQSQSDIQPAPVTLPRQRCYK